MRTVNVIGAGMTEFGRHPDTLVKSLASDACYRALQDANVPKDDIEYAVCGNFATALFGNQGKTVGQLTMKELGVTEIPVINVENGGASGGQAFQQAWMSVASGQADVALAFGVEKMTQVDTQKMLEVMANAGDMELEGANGLTWPGLYAMITRRRMHEMNITREQLATVSVNHHANAMNNPYAQRPKDLSVDDVLEAPVVADPLTIYDSCPTTDGAAAVVLASDDIADTYTSDPVRVSAATQTSGDYNDKTDIAHAADVGTAATKAYRASGMEPADVDVVEIHDAFTIEEPIYFEELGFCDPGEGGIAVENGRTSMDGDVPFCPSGGLLGRGHPLGASGIAQVCEIFWQLRGKADARQVPNATVGLTQIVGTFVNTNYGCIIIGIFEANPGA